MVYIDTIEAAPSSRVEDSRSLARMSKFLIHSWYTLSTVSQAKKQAALKITLINIYKTN